MMQQTETYKLNLIETSDTFSPSPLNENMEKLEAAIDAARAEAVSGDAAVTAAFQSADAALDARVQVLELHKIAYGTYTGNAETYGGSQFIPLPFTPAVLVIQGINTNVPGGGTYILLPGQHNEAVELATGGFRVYRKLDLNWHEYWSANTLNATYPYIAFC